jgi:hypothetical protein
VKWAELLEAGLVARDLKKEYQNYQGTPEQRKRNDARKAARRKMEKAGKVTKGDGKDVDHKNGNPKDNSTKNLRVTTKTAIFIGAIGLVAWFIRLESRSLRNSDDVVKEAKARKEELASLELRLEKQRKEDLAQRKEDRENTNEILRAVQTDIKLLLQKVGST